MQVSDDTRYTDAQLAAFSLVVGEFIVNMKVDVVKCCDVMSK